METVFITIHDLSPDARIKYCSESVEYILGYLPHEVKGKSCWDYFHPDEIPFGRLVHDQSLGLDKAAVFNYCRVKHKDGSWVGCECVFTVVYDVLIASTAIYQRGPKAQKRADDGANIRRIFSSSPRDSRYHMLSYISDKFYREPQLHGPEPRAALFLNRFTRTSAIMFATNGVREILGIEPSKLVGKSFYYCIAQNCLDDAIRCLESAKANDSIAYLRFRFRDPAATYDQPRLAEESVIGSDDEDDDGGVPITSRIVGRRSARLKTPTDEPNYNNDPSSGHASNDRVAYSESTSVENEGDLEQGLSHQKTDLQSRSSSDESAQAPSDTIFDPPSLLYNPSTTSTTPENEEESPIELEAVISCTSDGLVVVLRRAKPLTSHGTHISDSPYHTNGVFAAPWAKQPILPDGLQKSDIVKAESDANRVDAKIPSFMESIREVAVFAWSLTSINGSLVEHARGKPSGEALPPGGLPVWDPKASVDDKDNESRNGFASSTHRQATSKTVASVDGTKVTEIGNGTGEDSSEDEILWKRMPEQPAWRRPKRRASPEAFGADGDTEPDGKYHGSGTRASKSQRTQ